MKNFSSTLQHLGLGSVGGFANIFEGKEIYALEGKRLELKCAAESNHSSDTVQVWWMLNGNEVSTSSRRYLRNGNLIIERVDRFQDHGEYHCEMGAARVKNTKIFVRVKWIEEQVSVVLTSPERISDLKPGTDLTLECLASGSEVTNLKIDWTKNGERISSGDRISAENHLLRIKNASLQDNGMYRCQASNEAGYANSLNNFALKFSGENCASLNDISPDKIVKEGSSITLNCLYEKYDLLEWYFNENGPIKNNSRIAISSNTWRLRIDNVQKNDEGMYACVGVRKECDLYPAKYTTVISLADIEKTNVSLLEPGDKSAHVVAEGGNFTIACVPPAGKPRPTIRWSDQSDRTIATDDSSLSVSKHRLTINNAQKRHSGRYVCRAENVAGFVESWFDLTVTAPPRIIHHPSSQTVPEGGNVSFTCKYAAAAPPFTEIFWRKNNVTLTKNMTETTIGENLAVLNLSQIESSDAGEYCCVINSRLFAPVNSRCATLIVIQKLKFNPLPVPKKMELGLVNKIPCKAEGSDPPAVKWIRTNFKGDVLALPTHAKDVNGTLHFTQVRVEDKGRYTCIASNSQGIINVTIDVDVVVTPKFTVLPKNPSEGYEGSSVRLDCVAEGDPAPTIQWSQRDNNLVDISEKRFTTFSNGSLLISKLHLSDAGTYGCIAGNSGGFNRTDVFLMVRSLDGSGTVDGSLDAVEGGDTVGRTIVITLGAAGAYILLVVVLMAWCRYRRRKKKRTYSDLNVDAAEGDADADANAVAMDDEQTNLESNSSELKETSSKCRNQNGVGERVAKRDSSLGKYLSENCANLEFSRKNLHDIMLLGNGELGNVYLARNKCDQDAIVMVKVVEEMKPEFRRQLDVLKRVEHERVVKLIGICGEAEPVYMILEYTDWGDLKQFLIATRKSSVRVVGNKQRPAPLSVQQSLNIVEQAASAFEHLAKHQCTHRDIAARNCLITSGLNIKITFSSLCKNTYAAEYYEIRDQLVPLRWLPFEAVAKGEFNGHTDVYSYACLVWEIFTKGELPFSKLSNEEVLSLLEKRQLRWKVPKSMPSNLAKLLHKCWSVEAAERPTFSQITKETSEIDDLVNGK